MKEETIETTKDSEDSEDKKPKAIDVQAQVIFTVAAFVPDEGSSRHRWQRWISPSTSSIANEILDTLFQNKLPLPLLEVLLTHHIKPIFQCSVHPNINPTTGRKLPRQAGGSLASQDFYESQGWKEHPGVGNVLLWCLKHFNTECYEKIWHLLIPPIMTMLDDYEAKYKLVGIGIVREMLKTVPGYLLKRTGVESLIRSALSTSFAHLQSEESPGLVREAIHAQVDLTLLTTRPSEKAYFDQLADVLMGQGIVGSVWFYGYDKENVILASVEALPRVVGALGIGTVRFLKVLITQLTDPLLPKPLRYVPVQLQVASIEALWIVVQECSPRIDTKYAGMIADAVSRCWVNLVSQENDARVLGSGEFCF
ncbi:hypothetical protein M378DRAFT_177394 [Amanita muscaria Koide BX008]|uniref:Uncharacterized protein n=1 Tax=Amanita muscaria (strain Koide BX008) TaxID=946122 RepID=A0A0C2WZH8_AMAMK|nr:hypothetical protein M378DRAFT_177394 [Amanita muscaria Koide BX008]